MQSCHRLRNLYRAIDLAKDDKNYPPFQPYDLEELKALPYRSIIDRLPRFREGVAGWNEFFVGGFLSQSSFDAWIDTQDVTKLGLMRGIGFGILVALKKE